MDRKLKMRKNVILYMFSMLAVLMGCFFYTPKEAHAAEPGTVQVSAAQMVTYSSSDLPTEFTNPFDKAKKIIAYVVVSAGWVAFVVGILLLGIAFFGHQSDMKLQGFVSLGAGIMVGVAPTLATWIMS